MNIIICGSRYWSWDIPIREFIRTLHKDVVIVHGDAMGADKMAGDIAKEYGHKVIPEPALWDEHGRSAGPIRNQRMIDDHNPQFVMAFHQNIEESKGTGDMIMRASKNNIHYCVMNQSGELIDWNLIPKWYKKIRDIRRRILNENENRKKKLETLEILIKSFPEEAKKLNFTSSVDNITKSDYVFDIEKRKKKK